MATNKGAFAIDDTAGTLENLVVYIQILVAMDAPLGEALSPNLASLAAGRPVDAAAIWDVLYVATAAADTGSAPSGGGAKGGA